MIEELKDRGIIYKTAEAARRGEVVLLWACLSAANYRYIMEYGFQDDGSITFRLGSTGHNYGGSENDPHLHSALWRIDINLDGKDHNSAFLMERIEPPDEKHRLQAKSVHTRFHNGTTGGADWDSSKFTMLRVINTQKQNARKEFYGYDLVPARAGNARNFGEHEECTEHDFWVTRANPKQLDFRDVKTYCKPGDSIEDTDIVVWYSAPSFHEPRTEDGITTDGNIVGCTHVNWSSFTLRPSNIFDRTPLFPYKDEAKGAPRSVDLKTLQNMFKQVGLAYHNYLEANNQPPAKAKDLLPFLENAPDTEKLLTDSSIVFIYNVGLKHMKEGSSKTILAYEKAADEKGLRVVLFGDGHVAVLPDTDFQATAKAQPPQ